MTNSRNQQSLVDFEGGVKPDRSGKNTAHSTRADRAKHRRKLYQHGRCRAISKSKGCRCGAGADPDSDNQLCNYHLNSFQPLTLDEAPSLLARWCGVRPTEWEDIPEPCQNALLEIDPDGKEYP